MMQKDLFESTDELPGGMRYEPALICPDEEEDLLRHLRRQAFQEFEFHGFRGKRRVVSFGWRYNFDGSGLREAAEIPDFLLPARERAATFAQVAPTALEHALLIEYPAGAGIGWHKDRPVFGDVIGISLLAPCKFRLRRRHGKNWERRSLLAEPRSAYLLRGPSRAQWEHSIPPLETVRYSITLRTLSRGSGLNGG